MAEEKPDTNVTTGKTNNPDTQATNDNHSNNDGESDPSKKASPESSDLNARKESPFVKLVRSIKIADLEKEIKEEDGTTSILGKFKDYEQDLIDMTQDGTKKENIVKFVVGCIGINEAKAILFATRLLKAHSKQSQSNGM